MQYYEKRKYEPRSIFKRVKIKFIKEFTEVKIGAILYGSGYVLSAFLDTKLVSTGLLSWQQLIDAIAASW